MKLLKVHVHNYRHLKDVSLSFEPDLYPQVFAIGSENGGGKSTLLQLVFTLLHCAPEPELHEFAVNAIQHMKGSLEDWEAKIHPVVDLELLDKDGKNISISYLLYPVSSQEPENVKELSITDSIYLLFQANLLRNEMKSLYAKKELFEGELRIIKSIKNIEDDIKQIKADLRDVNEEIVNLERILEIKSINL